MHFPSPHPELARALLPHAFDRSDGAHDEAHLRRVWRNVEAIRGEEGGDSEILLAATLLHDCIWVDKASPERPLASRMAADKARALLTALGWAPERTEQACHAIAAHSFSAGIAPETTEAMILQDADRLDAMGHIGIARCLYLAGASGRAIYDPADPAARTRALDDAAFALDHFRTKLLTLGEGFRTATGRRLARDRAMVLRDFYDGLLAEVG